MLESLIGLVGLAETLISALSKIKIKKSDKKNIGQALATLYITLNEIVENGEIILSRLRKAKNGKKVDISELMDILFAQSERIKSIRSVIKKSNFSTILKIYLPKLKNLNILLERKGDRIAVLSEQLKTQKLRRFHPVSLDDQKAYRILVWREPILVPPSEELLKVVSDNLLELKELADQLRQFLVQQFNIEEII